MIRWWIPEGHQRPDHLPPGGIEVLRGGPTGAGTVVGGPWLGADEAGWLPTSGGWWTHPGHGDPASALRLAVYEAAEISDEDGRRWLVPILLAPAAGGWISTLPRRWSDQGWIEQPALAPLLHRLRQALPSSGERQSAANEDALAHLAMDLLALHYHLAAPDWAALGWLSERLAARVILAAAGLVEGAP